DVAVAHQPDRPAFRRFGRDMADGEARGAAREAAVGQERTGLPEPARLQVARRVQHFLHARAAARPLVADHHHFAGLHLVAEDRLDAGVLALEDAGGTGELQVRLVDASRLHDAAFERDIAAQDGETAILRKGVLRRADGTLGAVEVEFGPAVG